MIAFTVPDVPIAQPRPRAVRRGDRAGMAGPNKKHPIHAFQATVRMAIEQAYQGPPLMGPLYVSLTFVMPRPSSMHWKKRPMPRAAHRKKPDIDNLTKGVFDALHKLAWHDDSQVCRLEAAKVIASGDEAPHVVVRIFEVDNESEGAR